jgi:transposase
LGLAFGFVCGGERVTTERLAEIDAAFLTGLLDDEVGELLAEVERLREQLSACTNELVEEGRQVERMFLQDAAHRRMYVEQLDLVERLTEERDRLAGRVRAALPEHGAHNVPRPDGFFENCIACRIEEALVSLPVREDGPQSEAGGGKSRRSGEGPH